METQLVIPKIFENIPGLVARQTTRLGNAHSGLYPGFNLGESVGDDLDLVKANKDKLCQMLGFGREQLYKSKQVHGTSVKYVTSGGYDEGYDALITDQQNVLLAVTVADCVPILLYDEEHKAIAAIHSGWKGTEGNIINNTLLAMATSFGTHTLRIKAFIGACISGKNYEVGEDVASHFDAVFYSPSRNANKYMLDLKMVCKSQLQEAGVPEKSIEVSHYCTFEHNDLFYSHRKEKGKTGRMLAVIGMNNNKG